MIAGLIALAGVVIGFTLREWWERRRDAQLLRQFPPFPGIHHIAAPTTAEIEEHDDR